MKPTIKLLDKLWSQAIQYKYRGICVICRRRSSDSHHLVSRRNKSTRWMIDNGIALCMDCHRLSHDGHIKHRIPEEVRIKSRQVAKFGVEDYDKIISELKGYLKKGG